MGSGDTDDTLEVTPAEDGDVVVCAPIPEVILVQFCVENKGNAPKTITFDVDIGGGARAVPPTPIILSPGCKVTVTVQVSGVNKAGSPYGLVLNANTAGDNVSSSSKVIRVN